MQLFLFFVFERGKEKIETGGKEEKLGINGKVEGRTGYSKGQRKRN